MSELVVVSVIVTVGICFRTLLPNLKLMTFLFSLEFELPGSLRLNTLAFALHG